MRMRITCKKLVVLAVVVPLTWLEAGCSDSDGSSDRDTADSVDTSAPVPGGDTAVPNADSDRPAAGDTDTAARDSNSVDSETSDTADPDVGPFTGMPNPASVYCVALGYDEESTTTAEGVSTACVFPDGTSCEEWSFYWGDCGEEFSICAKLGLHLEQGDYTVLSSNAVCVDDNGEEVGAVADLAGVANYIPQR